MENREQLLMEYNDGPRILKDAIKKFPREMWSHRMEEDGRSIHEIIIHIADSEMVGYNRCRKIIAENGSELASYDQNAWCRELNYAEHDVDESLALFSMIRKLNYQLLKSTADIYWNTHAAYHADVGSMTLDDWLSIYTKHPYLHIEQMERIYEDWQERNA